MSLHKDRDEKEYGQPIVTNSLGLPALFLSARSVVTADEGVSPVQYAVGMGTLPRYHTR